MATTERDILEGKVLPELQAIASSMGVQGYQRLRKADLIGAIIAKAQGVEFVPSAPAKGRRGGATTEARGGDAPAAVADQPELPGAGESEAAGGDGSERRTRRRSRGSSDEQAQEEGSAETASVQVSGNGGQPANPGQPADAGAPPATLTEPSSNGEVAPAAQPTTAEAAPAGEASAPAESGAPPATRTDGAQA